MNVMNEDINSILTVSHQWKHTKKSFSHVKLKWNLCNCLSHVSLDWFRHNGQEEGGKCGGLWIPRRLSSLIQKDEIRANHYSSLSERDGGEGDRRRGDHDTETNTYFVPVANSGMEQLVRLEQYISEIPINEIQWK